MKKREGYVSNSSSSSFIIGLGVVKDENKLRKELKSCSESDYSIVDVKELENNSWSAEAQYDAESKTVSIEACVNSEPSISLAIEDEDKRVFVICVGNDEGDSSFWDGYDLNYDKVDYDWFSEDQQKLMDILSNEKIIEKSSGVLLGAERNG